MNWLTWFLLGCVCGLIVGVLIDKDKVYNINNRNKKGTLTIDDIAVNETKKKTGLFSRLKRKKHT